MFIGFLKKSLFCSFKAKQSLEKNKKHLNYIINILFTFFTYNLKFLKVEDTLLSLLGLLCALFSLLVGALIFSAGGGFTFGFCFLVCNFGYALFTPSLFSIKTENRQTVDQDTQGKIYGLLDSTDSIAALLSFSLIFFTRAIYVVSCMQISLFY